MKSLNFSVALCSHYCSFHHLEPQRCKILLSFACLHSYGSLMTQSYPHLSRNLPKYNLNFTYPNTSAGEGRKLLFIFVWSAPAFQQTGPQQDKSSHHFWWCIDQKEDHFSRPFWKFLPTLLGKKKAKRIKKKNPRKHLHILPKFQTHRRGLEERTLKTSLVRPRGL